MIKQLGIERFKSIRSLDIPCKKVNVFIGEPDTGKTNILDALQLLACFGWGLDAAKTLRLSPETGFGCLFYRQFYQPPMTISIDGQKMTFSLLGGQNLLGQGAWLREGATLALAYVQGLPRVPQLAPIAPYSFDSVAAWRYEPPQPGHGTMLLPPAGRNLIYVARHDQRVYDLLKEVVSGLGFKLFRSPGNAEEIYFCEERDGEIVQYNLDLLSDSTKRLFFYEAILTTTIDSTLVLDEPDVCAFPPYPKTLGELIALDKSNQFFLTTHNPYFLSALIEKTPKNDLAVFLCERTDDASTTARPLTHEQVQEVIALGADVFFNLENFEQK